MRYLIRFVLTDGQTCYAAKRTDHEVVSPMVGFEWLTVRFAEAKTFDSFSGAHDFLEIQGFGFSNDHGFSAYLVTPPVKSWEIISLDYSEFVY